MRLVLALLVWVLLESSAIDIGKAWQSSHAPGPVVTVLFKEGAQTGRVVYGWDGSQSLQPLNGQQMRIIADEVIQGEAGSTSNSSSIFDRAWRGLAPLVALFWLCVFIAWPPRPRRSPA